MEEEIEQEALMTACGEREEIPFEAAEEDLVAELEEEEHEELLFPCCC